MKMVIVIRKDLKCRRGKEISQSCHGAISAYKSASSKNIDLWEKEGSTKICVKVNSEIELLDVYKQAKSLGLNAALIQDAGRTEFHGELTYTVVAIGPDQDDKIDKITGKLELY